MSGGHFDYKQHYIQDIIDQLEDMYGNYDTENGCEELSEETFTVFEEALQYLHLAKIYTQRIDWLLSGDDSEDTFHERLASELKDFWDEWYNVEEDYHD
jgi:hypothetical protein